MQAGKHRSPFQKAEGEKRNRFGGLIRVAERLTKQRLLGFTPFFLFPVVSSLGCVNADMTKLLKWISERYKQTLLPSAERLDGVPKSVLLGQFQMYLDRALCFAVIRANALALHSQKAGRASAMSLLNSFRVTFALLDVSRFVSFVLLLSTLPFLCLTLATIYVGQNFIFRRSLCSSMFI